MPVRWHREGRLIFDGYVIFTRFSLLPLCVVNSDATGSFPDYPEEEDGGSALIFAEKNPQQVKYTLSPTWFIAHFFSWRKVFVIHLSLIVNGRNRCKGRVGFWEQTKREGGKDRQRKKGQGERWRSKLSVSSAFFKWISTQFL